MTNISSFILILVCLGIGFVIEPAFFSGSKSSTVAVPAEVMVDDVESEVETDDVASPDPAASEPVSENTGGMDFGSLTPADFPAKVTLKIAYVIEDAASGVTMNLKAGAKVKPLRVDGDILIFQPVGLPIEGQTELSNTNFESLLAPLIVKRAEDAEFAGNDMEADTTPDPVVESDPVVEPEVVAPKVAAEQLDEQSIVKMMKASVAAGEVSEFLIEQVVAWEAGASLEFDGETYQTGLVTFKAETILGPQDLGAIALIDGSEVVKWLWANKAKLEMK